MSSSTWFGEAAAYERKQREDGAGDARGAALGAEERAELERLRAEVAALRSQVQAGGTGGGRPGPPGRVDRRRWRTVVAAACIVVACVLAPLSAVAVWTRNQVTNTDR